MQGDETLERLVEAGDVPLYLVERQRLARPSRPCLHASPLLELSLVGRGRQTFGVRPYRRASVTPSSGSINTENLKSLF
jgi:hypothetical protein